MKSIKVTFLAIHHSKVNKFLCSSRKYPNFPNKRNWKLQGSQKIQKFKVMCEDKFEFPESGGS